MPPPRLTVHLASLQYSLHVGVVFSVRRGRGALGNPHENGGRRSSKVGLYVEDALILLAVAALFVLGVFFRGTLWGQGGLGVVLVVMIIVFIRRLRRVHRAFLNGDEEE
jgi:hypothetical protein